MKNYLFFLILRVLLLYLILAIVIAYKVKAEQLIKIGIIDTGYNAEYAKEIGATPLKLCPKGHYDFLTNTPTLSHQPAKFYMGDGNHGTLVASIIAEKLKDVNYCAVIIQLYTTWYGANYVKDFDKRIVKALKIMEKQQVLAVNMSYSGFLPCLEEKLMMHRLANRGVSFFVAAGNNKINLNNNCVSYPACYDLYNKYAIGALVGVVKCPVTNTGNIVDYYSGTLPFYWKVSDKCATSYATPVALSKFVLSVQHLLHGDYHQKLVPTMQQ